MYVCVCNKVTDSEIHDAYDRGVDTLDKLSAELKVATCCGRCRDCARRVLNDARESQVIFEPGLVLA